MLRLLGFVILTPSTRNGGSRGGTRGQDAPWAPKIVWGEGGCSLPGLGVTPGAARSSECLLC